MKAELLTSAHFMKTVTLITKCITKGRELGKERGEGVRVSLCSIEGCRKPALWQKYESECMSARPKRYCSQTETKLNNNDNNNNDNNEVF